MAGLDALRDDRGGRVRRHQHAGDPGIDFAASVPLNEQGALQGALDSLSSLSGILGPLLATGLFGYFSSDRAPARVPGAAFYAGSLLVFCALLLALRSFRKAGLTEPGASV